jgi:tetratricopeptide (TPR) repeat protein
MELGRAVLDRAGGDDELEWIWLINATEVVAANPEEQAGLFDRALLVAARIPGPSWRVATVEGTRGNALADRGLFAEALPHHQKAIAIYEQEYGPNNLRAYDTYCNVVFDLVGMQRFADALPLIPQLDELQNRVDPAGDDSWTRSVEANALRGLGRLDEALAQDRKAVATCEKFQGPDAPSCADAWAGVGMDLLEQGDTSGALAALETAVKLYGESPPREASFALARALPPSQLDRARALAHAAKAKADDLAAHGGTPPERDAIATWLANHPI